MMQDFWSPRTHIGAFDQNAGGNGQGIPVTTAPGVTQQHFFAGTVITRT